MSDKQVVKPVAVAVGTALAGSFAVGANADTDAGASPFAMTTLASGYLLGAQEGSCGEGKCGGDKEAGSEGSCGGDKEAEGSCGGDKEDKEGEGACGEGSCGGDKEGEGACGEGSCGGSV